MNSCIIKVYQYLEGDGVKKYKIQTINEVFVPYGGLAMAGLMIHKTALPLRASSLKVPASRVKISNADILSAYIGLLCQGRNDFDHMDIFRDEPFFMDSLQLKTIPSSATLRQRLEQLSADEKACPMVMEESAVMIQRMKGSLTPCYEKLVALDIDVSVFDNSGSHKEGIELTYQKVDGYAPIFAYLGEEGYCVGASLRKGSDHSQKDAPAFIQESIRICRRINPAQELLLRADSAHDSADTLNICHDEQVQYLIKRNPRKESPEDWLSLAKDQGIETIPREGKKVYTGSLKTFNPDINQELRLVYQITETTVAANGQLYLIPDINIDTWWTSLTAPEETVIKLYHQHATSEQFHSELKTDLDLERLPSGKFATNQLILTLGAFTYNLLRLIGLETLKKDDAPISRKNQRRRIKTVIKNMIYLAVRLVNHARSAFLKFSRYCRWFTTFNRVYEAFYAC